MPNKVQYLLIADRGKFQQRVRSADSWIPIIPIWIREGGQQIFWLTGVKNVGTISSNATQSLMQVRCFFGRKCMCAWAAQTRALSFAAIGNYGQRWLLREELHT